MLSVDISKADLPPGLVIESLTTAAETGFRINFAVSVVLIYDHIITFDDEVAKIWSMPWSPPKVIFLLNRYLTPPLLIFEFAVQAINNVSENFCEAYKFWQAWPPRLALLTAELLIIIRVSAIYGNNKAVIAILLLLFLAELTTIVTVIGLTIPQVLGYPSHPGCVLISESTTLQKYASASWIAPVIFESIIIAITAYKVIPTSETQFPLIKLLARDSLIYFGFMFALSLANVVTYEADSSVVPVGTLIGPSSAIACLAIGRMMINMKTYDDQNANLAGQELQKLSALKFGGAIRTVRSDGEAEDEIE